MTERSDSGVSNDRRICLFSNRLLQRFIWRCAAHEFEDVIREVDAVDLVAPEPHRSFVVGQKVANRLVRYLSVVINPGIRKIRLKRSYDLFFAICHSPRDLLSVNTIEGWRERCRTSVCWIEEIWAGELHKWGGHLNILSKFDYIVLSCSASALPVQDAIRRPCLYMPPGIDSIRFSPYPNPPPRFIDVYSLGRRSPVTHQALLKMADSGKIFYIYDTIRGKETFDHKEHRSLTANIVKRSRYFLANKAKIDQLHEIHGQSEIGFRYFEGAAAGTVMIGDHPETDAFRTHFDWPDAVIRIPFDAPDISKVLADLDRQTDRLEEIRKNNIVNSLLRHDWVYRWMVILDMVGLEPVHGAITRKKRLKDLAALVMRSDSHPDWLIGEARQYMSNIRK